MPDLMALYNTYLDAVNRMNAASAEADTAQAALVAAMPADVEFSLAPDHPPVIKVANGRIEIVTKPFLGDPLPAVTA